MEIDNCTLAPFYEHMQTILNSTPLDLNIKKSSKKRLDFKGSHIFDFTLNFDTIKLLSESRTKSIKLDVRLIIRFCKIINVVDSEGKNLSMRDAFPQHLTIYIDGKPITLSKYLPYDSDRRDGRRNARLIDVTDAVVDAKSLQHQIIIQWVQDDCHEIFSYSLYLVRRRSLHNLSYSLTRSQTCSIKRTASLFRERIYYPSSNKDIEYMVQTIIVKNASLICPISFCRIITPARGTLCTHLQCFDLDTFLLMNFMKPTWICPICDENLYFTCLEIDGLILSILNEKRSQSISEIKFNEEGHWKSNDFIYEDDIDDGNYFGIPKSYSFYKFNENEINKDKIADEISSKLSRKQMNIDLLKLLPPTNWKEYNLPTTILNALSCNEIAIPQSNPNEDIIQTNTPTDVDAPSDNAIIHTTKRNHSDSLTDFPNNSNQNNIPIKKSKLSIKTMQKENITNVNNENAVIESRLDSNFPSDSFHNNNKEIPINKSKLAIRNIPKENITHVNNKKSVEDETKNDSEEKLAECFRRDLKQLNDEKEIHTHQVDRLMRRYRSIVASWFKPDQVNEVQQQIHLLKSQATQNQDEIKELKTAIKEREREIDIFKSELGIVNPVITPEIELFPSQTELRSSKVTKQSCIKRKSRLGKKERMRQRQCKEKQQIEQLEKSINNDIRCEIPHY